MSTELKDSYSIDHRAQGQSTELKDGLLRTELTDRELRTELKDRVLSSRTEN